MVLAPWQRHPCWKKNKRLLTFAVTIWGNMRTVKSWPKVWNVRSHDLNNVRCCMVICHQISHRDLALDRTRSSWNRDLGRDVTNHWHSSVKHQLVQPPLFSADLHVVWFLSESKPTCHYNKYDFSLEQKRSYCLQWISTHS